MIGDIIFGKEKSKITLIEDTVLQNGRSILCSLLCQMCERVEKVYLLCFERDPSFITDQIQDKYKNKIVSIDVTQDLLGWDGCGLINLDTNLIEYLQNFPHSQPSLTCCVLIDSISPLLLHRTTPYTCKTLTGLLQAKIHNSLSPLLLHRTTSYTCKTLTGLLQAKIHTAEVEQVACLLHRDLHDNHCLSLVEHLVTTIIKVKPPTLPQFLLSCNILHKRPSGKVIKVTEHLNFDDDLRPKDITEIKSVANPHVAMEINQADPTANLTFNLSLTEKEKQARSEVKLPYTYDNVRQDETLNRSVGEGKIFYQPDEADDFDEEDPDDDLDI